jgi:hypothetical protein
VNSGKPDTNEGFLSRWSRRKLSPEQSDNANSLESPVDELAVNDTAVLDADERQLPMVEPMVGQGAEQHAEPPVLTDEDMPPIESLNEASDFSGFMSPGVSDELRKLALRKLFSATAFNVVDGLDDYDEDFTTFEKLGDIITSDMRYQMERVAESLEDESDLSEVDEVEDVASQATKPDEIEAIENETQTEAKPQLVAEESADLENSEPLLSWNDNQEIPEEKKHDRK